MILQGGSSQAYLIANAIFLKDIIIRKLGTARTSRAVVVVYGDE